MRASLHYRGYIGLYRDIIRVEHLALDSGFKVFKGFRLHPWGSTPGSGELIEEYGRPKP